MFVDDCDCGESNGVMGFIPANHIKILPYGDDGNEKVEYVLASHLLGVRFHRLDKILVYNHFFYCPMKLYD